MTQLRDLELRAQQQTAKRQTFLDLYLRDLGVTPGQCFFFSGVRGHEEK